MSPSLSGAQAPAVDVELSPEVRALLDELARTPRAPVPPSNSAAVVVQEVGDAARAGARFRDLCDSATSGVRGACDYLRVFGRAALVSGRAAAGSAWQTVSSPSTWSGLATNLQAARDSAPPQLKPVLVLVAGTAAVTAAFIGAEEHKEEIVDFFHEVFGEDVVPVFVSPNQVTFLKVPVPSNSTTTALLPNPSFSGARGELGTPLNRHSTQVASGGNSTRFITPTATNPAEEGPRAYPMVVPFDRDRTVMQGDSEEMSEAGEAPGGAASADSTVTSDPKASKDSRKRAPVHVLESPFPDPVDLELPASREIISRLEPMLRSAAPELLASEQISRNGFGDWVNDEWTGSFGLGFRLRQELLHGRWSGAVYTLIEFGELSRVEDPRAFDEQAAEDSDLAVDRAPSWDDHSSVRELQAELEREFGIEQGNLGDDLDEFDEEVLEGLELIEQTIQETEAAEIVLALLSPAMRAELKTLQSAYRNTSHLRALPFSKVSEIVRRHYQKLAALQLDGLSSNIERRLGDFWLVLRAGLKSKPTPFHVQTQLVSLCEELYDADRSSGDLQRVATSRFVQDVLSDLKREIQPEVQITKPTSEAEKPDLKD